MRLADRSRVSVGVVEVVNMGVIVFQDVMRVFMIVPLVQMEP